MNKIIIIGALLALAGIYVIGVVKAKNCPLIPRVVLFGNLNKKMQPLISPDGTMLAYLAPVNNVMNIWLKSIDKADDKPITSDKDRGISSFIWALDNKKILYIQDQGGNENWRLYGVLLEDGTIKDYTPFEDVQVHIVAYEKSDLDHILIEINKRDPKAHDLFKLNLTTGNLELIAQNTGRVVEWIVDENLNLLAKIETVEDGSYNLFFRNSVNDEWRLIATWSVKENIPAVHSLSKDTQYIYAHDSRSSNTSRFVKINTQTGEIIELFVDPEYDITGSLLIDRDTREALAVSYVKSRLNWVFFRPDIEETFNYLRNIDHGDISLVSRTLDNMVWIVAFNKDNGPVSYWIFNRKDNKATFLFDHQPLYSNYTLSSMEPISFQARDGLTIHGYLTLPCNGKRENLPLIINVHGGPWLRDSWGFNPEVQWLANRGYAVLQINYRASKGYGKNFMNAGNKQWGQAMQDDLTDGVHWAIEQGIADPKRVAIYGSSYGGYAALAGATFTPDLYCCAVDIVGISNLTTFIKTIPPYWSSMLEYLHDRVGNPDTQKEFLDAYSPLFHVDKIKIPMLIAQGANDPRVKQAESEQIVAAMKEKGIKYEYLLFPDEGHGFVKHDNKLKFYQVAEKFLAEHLGGRYES